MKIAIMGAMYEEITPLLEFFKTYETIEYANNRYYKASYQGLELIIAYSKIGKVNASLTASTLIEKFGAEKLLFSGVAGALNPTLKVGDLVVATRLVQHDVDISAFGHPFGYIPEGCVYVQTDETLVHIAHKVAKAQGLKLVEGIIATGDQFICDSTKKEWIRSTFQADATEMEGASVAVVCDALHVPFCVFRAISDAADMDAGFSFDEFLVSSAQESAKLILAMLDELKR